MIDMLSIPPIIEERCRGVDVDPRSGRIARQPPQTLHGDGKLARAISGPGVQRIERIAPDDSILLEPEIALQLFYRSDELGRVARRGGRGLLSRATCTLHSQVTDGLQCADDLRDPGIAAPGLDRLAVADGLKRRLRRELKEVDMGLAQRSILVGLRSQRVRASF